MSFDGISKDSPIIKRELKASEFTFDSPIKHSYGAIYSEALSFQIHIYKEYGNEFDQKEICSIVSWLTSPCYPRKLEFIEFTGNPNYKDIEYFGTFNEAKYFERNTTKDGIRLFFECNAPYGFTHEFSQSCISTSSNKGSIAINNTSDATYSKIK